MFLHELRSPAGARHRRKIVGRGPGSGHGKTSCRGQKGQMARQGVSLLRGFEGGQMRLLQRLPKVGFHSKSPTVYQTVNLDSLNRFKEGTEINIDLLKEEGLIKRRSQPYKILNKGDLKKSLVIFAHHFSEVAREKILKAGGKAELITNSTADKTAKVVKKK